MKERHYVTYDALDEHSDLGYVVSCVPKKKRNYRNDNLKCVCRSVLTFVLGYLFSHYIVPLF